LHYNRSERLDESRSLVLSSYEVSSAPTSRQHPMVLRVIGA